MTHRIPDERHLGAFFLPDARTHANDAAGKEAGATAPSRVRFTVWSPRATNVHVALFDDATRERTRVPLTSAGDGFFTTTVDVATKDVLYKFVLDGNAIPDPYARFLPFGVHGPARVESAEYAWKNAARGLTRDPLVYELHVGTFTPEGTYAAAITKLDALVDLGVDTIELLPLAAFDGHHGWGYDGVASFAPHAPYGTPDDLRAFVDAAHGHGLSVVIDVVYNHFGPSGSYLKAYAAEYFTAEGTAWGDAPNFASDNLRRFVTSNARMWLEDYRADGLRLDATHSYRADREPSILRELSEYAASLTPKRALFAEDERNEAKLITRDRLDGIWADDFHHQLRVTLTGEREGYYRAYQPGLADLARTLQQGWLYEGTIYPPSGKPRGTKASDLAPPHFVYCIENHDQIGNRAMGDRFTESVSVDAYRAASLLLLALPMTPLLFMGQEWGASSPFLFFTDHHPDLGQKIIEGRRSEFKGFPAFNDPEKREKIPNPQAESTFAQSKLRWSERTEGDHAATLDLYKRAIALRHSDPSLKNRTRDSFQVEAKGGLLLVHRRAEDGTTARLIAFNPTKQAAALPTSVGKLILASRHLTDAIPPETTAIFTLAR